MKVLLAALMVVGLLSGCTPRAKDATMTEAQIMSDIESVLGQFDTVLVENRCASEYAQLHLNGGCYLSRVPSEDTAKAVAQALVKAGFEPQRSLRLDFGAWSTVLKKNQTALAFSVEPLTRDSGEKYAADRKAGYQSKVTVSLSDAGGK
ncbi:hypothetical protein [Deinococcus multiflagellatus]|uniref:Lipoprotein n=1 Tax=Deinococcus multiflagellatus TaxID=1656887 RepID=A0ABW1ZPJ6_9DEIO|nr:hypothetical protein [Deinococcus multiflagellatus]MBZ9715376.1 hypothetical protein [Deinococcus multiflagellatus]